MGTEDRQSDTDGAVRDPEAVRASVMHLARQIQKAMVLRGWVLRDGRLDVGRLRQAVEEASGEKIRWQTVQAWALGRNQDLPEADNLDALARALEMTLDELIGIASGAEPTNDAWKAFLQTDEGQAMTSRQRALVARAVVDEGDPTVGSYMLTLAAVRSGRKP